MAQSHIFISYSKQDIGFARHLRDLLQDAGFSVWLDETKLVPSERWWSSIERNIDNCAALLVIMSPRSKTSDWVEREILHAERRRKPIFPILLEGEYWSRLANVEYEDMTAGLNAVLSDRLIEVLTDYVPHHTGDEPPPQLPGERIAHDTPPDELTAFSPPTIRRDLPVSLRGAVIGAVALIAVILIVLVLLPALQPDLPPATVLETLTSDLTATPAERAVIVPTSRLGGDLLPTATGTDTPTFTATWTPSSMPTPTLTPSATDTDTPSRTPSPPPTPTPSETLPLERLAETFEAGQTATAGSFQTATADQWTPTPTPNRTSTFIAFLTQRAQQTSTAIMQATMDAWTDTPTPTFTPTSTFTPTDTPSVTPTPTDTPIPAGYPGNPVTHNDQWQPVTAQFDGVERVLVPAGCFQMGSEDGDEDERPQHQVCFDTPFWIDRYEVTNGQFSAFGGVARTTSYWSDDDRPRERISWNEAYDFCALRGVRLPTEAEWEFAARGPDSLIYPWGSTFNGDNVVYSGNAHQTAAVGSRPGGVSWVGALDLSGNVWEWVGSLFAAPYDGSEQHLAGRHEEGDRVLRGASWSNLTSSFRSAYRAWFNAGNYNYNWGFRCAQDWGGENS